MHTLRTSFNNLFLLPGSPYHLCVECSFFGPRSLGSLRTSLFDYFKTINLLLIRYTLLSHLSRPHLHSCLVVFYIRVTWASLYLRSHINQKEETRVRNIRGVRLSFVVSFPIQAISLSRLRGYGGSLVAECVYGKRNICRYGFLKSCAAAENSIFNAGNPDNRGTRRETYIFH